MTRRPTELTPVLTAPAEVDLRRLITADSLLIALDFDGVLAPLQDDPETSRMEPDSAAAIDALARLPRTRVALVSGRDIATLRRLSAVPETVWLIGSHGAEAELGAGPEPSAAPESAAGPELAAGTELGAGPEPAAGASATRSPDLTAEEARMLAAIDAHIVDFEHSLEHRGDFPGVRVEAKPYSRTVHTRGLAPELAAALHDHAAAVSADYPDIRVIEGHDVTELAVKQATKGDGLRLLARAEQPTAMAYFGDDVTDEDAFAALEQLIGPAETSAPDQSPPPAAVSATARRIAAGLSVKVGRAPTRAQCRIADPAAVALVLERLAAERAEHLDRNRV